MDNRYVVCTNKGTVRCASTEKSINETSGITPEQARYASQVGVVITRTGMVGNASQWY